VGRVIPPDTIPYLPHKSDLSIRNVVENNIFPTVQHGNKFAIDTDRNGENAIPRIGMGYLEGPRL
jgi:hypothetical protein